MTKKSVTNILEHLKPTLKNKLRFAAPEIDLTTFDMFKIMPSLGVLNCKLIYSEVLTMQLIDSLKKKGLIINQDTFNKSAPHVGYNLAYNNQNHENGVWEIKVKQPQMFSSIYNYKVPWNILETYLVPL